MLKNYFITAWRNLRRYSIFSFINISGLALSFAAVWLIALFVAHELSYDRYHEKASRIYRMVSHGKWGTEKFDITGTSGLAAAALKNDFPEVEDAVRIHAEGGGILTYEDKTIKEGNMFFSDPSFFTVFTWRFLAGNTHALEKPNSIVLTRSLAGKLFPDPASALNKTVKMDNTLYTVTGVIDDVPVNTHFNFKAVRSFPADFRMDWGVLEHYTYVLLKKNADINRLRAKMPAFATKYLTINAQNIHFTLELQPLTSIHLQSHLAYELSDNHDIKYTYVISIVGLLILLIALINYINITTARASVRLREVAVRKIIGSNGKNLIGLFLTESFLTILCAATISLVLVILTMPLFNYVTGKQLSIWQFGVARTILCILTFCFITVFIGGWYPAFFLTKFKTIPALKNQLGDVKGQTIFRKSLVLFQFAITVIMITTSLIIYLQLNFMVTTDLGFNKKQVLTFHLDSRAVRTQVEALRTALLQNPMVQAVATVSNPIGNNNIGMTDYSTEKNGVFDNHTNLAYYLTIDPDFIPAMQIKLLEGRNYSKTIASDSVCVMVNEAFVKKQGWASAMGKRISRGTDSTGKFIAANIIGVVKDFHIYSLQHQIGPMVMELPRQLYDRDNVYVRIDDHNTAQTIKYLENTFRKFDTASPFEYHFLEQNFAEQYEAEQKQGKVLLGFTILTIVISCLGLFGLITFTVGKRVKEIGIRKVLGASVQNTVLLLTKSLLQVVLISLLLAVPVSWLISNKWLEDFAYRIHLQWWMFALAGIISLIIAFATLSVQAIKAALANPAVALRSE
ncbi:MULTISPECIES: ABC transporter permease [Niastella]|uniref:ABC transporter permease n=1 Tax=Niastella soli TaxID=2821487 RepID=A0ABS3YY04_9BACT|nr:ABC transporter permease [Niastella soli]MBO9202392.1 ABC transporter permease [Niastella soli]